MLKDKCPKLYEAIQARRETYIRWLQQTDKALELCQQLPVAILNLDLTDADVSGGALHLDIGNKDGTIRTLLLLGAEGLNPEVSRFNKDIFYAYGELKLTDGTRACISLHGLSKPADCRIVTHTRVVEENILVCEKTGEAPTVAATLVE